jgi:hypothetical protein
MYKTIAELEKKRGWTSRVLQWEDSATVKTILGTPGCKEEWYYVDFYDIDDYSHGIRIEGTKEDLQKIVDMLNFAIHRSEENTLEIRTVSKPGAILKVDAVSIPPKIQSKMAEAIRAEKQ